MVTQLYVAESEAFCDINEALATFVKNIYSLKAQLERKLTT